MIVFILGLIFLLLSIYFFTKSKTIKLEKDYEKATIIDKQNEQINEKKQKLEELNKQIIDSIARQKTAEERKIYYEGREKEASENLEKFNQTLSLAKDSYVSTLEKAMEAKETEYAELLEKYKDKIDGAAEELRKLKSSIAAGNKAKLREQEKKDNLEYYKLKLPSGPRFRDLEELLKLKNTFSEPDVISKIIWSCYFQKQSNDLCNRILKGVECGIYKITNLENGLVYIGQSRNLSNRIKTHIKCGLGIDTPSSNKLYQYMQDVGVWCFTFELLEECKVEELNRKEKQWIDIYQANIYGMNSTAGNK